MAKVNQIAANLTFKGQGIVQFNGKEHPFLAKGERIGNSISSKNINDNCQYAMKVFYKSKDGDGNEVLNESVVLTADGIRHATHIKEHSMLNPSVALDRDTAINFLADLGTLERGFVFTQGDYSGFKRKGIYGITDAVEKSGTLPFLTTHGNSQPKTKKDTDDDKSATSLFSREQVGETEYQAKAFIDLTEASFISCSRWHDRQSFNPEIAKDFIKKLEENFGKAYNKLNPKYHFDFTLPKLHEVGWYQKDGDVSAKAEQGILLPPEYVVVLVYDLLDKISKINWIKNQSGYVKTSAISVAKVSGIEIESYNEKVLSEFKLSSADISTDWQLAIDGEVFWKTVEAAEAKAKKEKKERKAKPQTDVTAE